MPPIVCFGLFAGLLSIALYIILNFYVVVKPFIEKVPIVFTGFFVFYFGTLLFCPFFQDMDFSYFMESFPGFFSTFNIFDSFSVCLCLMTSFFFFICIWLNVDKHQIKYNFLLLLMQLLLFFCFTTSDLLVFYISFELITLLMYFVILFWGYESRKSLASFYFFYFTFLSSLFFLVGIISIYSLYSTTNLYILLDLSFTRQQQFYYWWLFFFAFAVKIPMYPFHIWLPEAHVEAPTGGSIILAAILLKLGFYGLFRFSIPLFFWVSQYYSIFIFVMALFGVYHSMIVALRQVDAKRIVAYSSVAHMNFAIIGLFTNTVDGILGSMLFMFSHGLVSGALFYLIGMLYKRHGTRSLFYYGGLLKYMPIFALFSFLFMLGNIAFPLTFNFVGELLIFFSIVAKSKLLIIFLILPLILNLVNSLLLFVRTCYGVFKYNRFTYFIDCFYKDYFVLWFCFVFVWILGLCPNYLLDFFIADTYWWQLF